MIIAIDGPAASGKGTLARRLAAEFDLPYLDTGLTYRAVAAQMQADNVALTNEAAAISAARKLNLAALDREILSDHQTGAAASRVAVMPGLRAELVALQRKFASNGAVMDGRDIGTVVCPDAPVKLFVTASAQARAQRRFEEVRSKGNLSSYAEILRDIRQRDERDSSRTISPLEKAADAHLIDTTKMDIETAFQAAKTLVLQAIGP
uniref:(d)CMP kinase n=1 Tax=Pararhizobium sp. IMCC3301 TaxID=3067904 RepID=UPI002742036C|nr:(d)CMP kinase [Pararhizobium sp. IMCC3301]